jgi:glucitol operon activator protein
MDTGFALILISVLLLGFALSFLQHRSYSRAAQRMTRAFAGEKDFFLVSGRGKGVLRGAVLLMVIDAKERRVIAAEAMIGITIFARFRGRPELIGPLDGVAARAKEPKLRDAVDYALANFASLSRGRKSKPATG